MKLKAFVPWPAKVAIKFLIAGLPVPHRVWKRLGVFEHSNRSPAQYVSLVSGHRERSRIEAGFTVLELGPGDSVASAIVMAAMGAKKVFLSDVGRFADANVASYEPVARALRGQGLTPIDPLAFGSLDEMLGACNAEYLTNGLDGLRMLPDGCVDLIWSHAVLEHVRRRELGELFGELRRIAAPESVHSHAIDLKDHLAGRLLNLRVPSWLWEAKAVASAGFYTNRARRSDFLEVFHRAGLQVVEQQEARWDDVPIRRNQLAAEFRRYTDAELLVHELSVVLTPRRIARDHEVHGVAERGSSAPRESPTDPVRAVAT